jgi:hypothetical protein
MLSNDAREHTNILTEDSDIGQPTGIWWMKWIKNGKELVSFPFSCICGGDKNILWQL